MKSFRWTGNRERAALLVAQDDRPDDDIAAELGISGRQLDRWKRHPEFAARVASIVEETRKAVLARGIADRQNRIDALNDRWKRMQTVIGERARQHERIDSLKASPAAGASSGLMVLTVRYLPGGGRVEEWAVDTGLLKEMRETEKQAAQELGQWTEKNEPGGTVVIREYGVNLDQV